MRRVTALMRLLDRRFSHQGMVAVWILFLFLIWELAAWLINQLLAAASPSAKLPYFHQVLTTMLTHYRVLLHQGGITFGNSVIGFAIGALFGLALAVVMSLSKAVQHTLSPYMIASQMVPIIGLAPIVYGIVHDASVSRILISAYVTFFPVTIHMLRGLRSVPENQLELMKSYGASVWTTYYKLKLTAALPGLFSGLKISAPLAITAAIVVELMGAPNGIGVLMLSSMYYGSSQIDMFWSTIMVCIGLGFLAFLLISALERIVTPWQPEFRLQERR
jgi:NitT/TauT family transport system permease protein